MTPLRHRLGSTKGALNQGVLFIFCIYMCSQSITTLGIPQCLGDVAVGNVAVGVAES